jgi:hypothetical protein
VSVTDRLMGIGAWRLTLRPDTPRTVLDIINIVNRGFSHIVITPAPVEYRELSDASILSLARYTGVYRKQDSEYVMSGPGLGMWLIDENGKGSAYVTGVSTATGAWSEWIGVITPSTLVLGTNGTYAGNFAKAYPRVMLGTVSKEVLGFFNAEYDITPNFVINYGDLSSGLFRNTPIAMIVRNAADAGRDTHVAGIHGSIDLERDLEGWVRRVNYYTGTDASPTISQANGGVAPIDVIYRAPDGSAAIMDKSIDNFNPTPTVAGSTLAARDYTLNASARSNLTLSSDEYDIGATVNVGDNLYVYDPLRGIVDTTVQVQYRGGTINPATIRCVGLTWPIKRGMGVYLRYWTKTAVPSWVLNYLDLTPYVVWEDRGTTTVEVGSKPRSFNT